MGGLSPPPLPRKSQCPPCYVVDKHMLLLLREEETLLLHLDKVAVRVEDTVFASITREQPPGTGGVFCVEQQPSYGWNFTCQDYQTADELICPISFIIRNIGASLLKPKGNSKIRQCWWPMRIGVENPCSTGLKKKASFSYLPRPIECWTLDLSSAKDWSHEHAPLAFHWSCRVICMWPKHKS